MRVGSFLLVHGVALVLVVCCSCRTDRPEPGPPPPEAEPDETVRPGRSETEKRPDILLLTVDTLRTKNLSFYGYGVETAPFLASLAARATVYRRAFSSSSWTVPAAASALTGVYPATHGAIHGVVRQGQVHFQEVLPEGLATIAQALRATGYRTYAVVANDHIDEHHGFARGFDNFDCIGFASAEDVGAAVSRWTDEIAAAEQPVFLWAHYFDPHQPCLAREPWFSRFRPDVTDEERARLAALSDRREIWTMITQEGRRGMDLGIAMYDSEIAYTDHHIERLFERMPFLDRFLIMMTADHGDEYLEHGDVGHGWNLYNESLGVPFFIRQPGGGPQRLSDHLVSLIDVPPTLAAAAGVAVDDRWQGREIPFSDTSAPVDSREIVAEVDRFDGYFHSALIGERWKLLWNRSADSVELYDLVSDPGERTTRIERNRGEAAAMLERLKNRIGELRADFPAATTVVDPDKVEALEKLGYVER